MKTLIGVLAAIVIAGLVYAMSVGRAIKKDMEGK